MPNDHPRTARIEARIAPEALAVVKQAAQLQGRSVSDFVVAAAQEAAVKTIHDLQILQLSAEDQRAFVQALLDSGKPHERMVRAFKHHRDLIQE